MLALRKASKPQLQAQKLRLARSQGPYYGGSLPNVNQIGRSHQDHFQGSFPSSLESNRSTRHHGLVERVQRDRGFVSPVRPYSRQVDSSPYNSAYLSPPPDPSWRRTNSDSALHTSVMNPPQGDPFSTGGPLQSSRRSGQSDPAGQSDGEGRRMFPYPVPPIEENMLDEGKLLKPWDTKKLPLLSSRPKSCEVPGINIFSSPEQPPPPPGHGVPASLNTGGSLPDLSSLHFPSPLPTPLDQDEPCYPGCTSLSGGSSTGNLASTLTQLGINAANAQGGNANFHHHTPGLMASLQTTLSNPSLQSSLSNPNIQSSLSNHSFSNSLSSASLHSSLSNPSLQSSLSSSPSLQSSLSSQSLHSSLSSSSLQSVSSGNPGYGGGGSSSFSPSLSTSPRRRVQLSPSSCPWGGTPGGITPSSSPPPSPPRCPPSHRASLWTPADFLWTSGSLHTRSASPSSTSRAPSSTSRAPSSTSSTSRAPSSTSPTLRAPSSTSSTSRAPSSSSRSPSSTSPTLRAPSSTSRAPSSTSSTISSTFRISATLTTSSCSTSAQQ
ncbi:hypothetical protein KUCAC02_032156, partial [Chaenocephalus aceratus]